MGIKAKLVMVFVAVVLMLSSDALFTFGALLLQQKAIGPAMACWLLSGVVFIAFSRAYITNFVSTHDFFMRKFN